MDDVGLELKADPGLLLEPVVVRMVLQPKLWNVRRGFLIIQGSKGIRQWPIN
jgi:hypothetical protein